MVASVRHNDHEDELERNAALDGSVFLDCLEVLGDNIVVVGLDLTGEGSEELVFVLESLVVDCDNLGKLNVNT